MVERPSLHVVTDTPEADKPETVSERVRRLQAEARSLAHDHLLELGQKLVELHAMAAEIHAGGDVYIAGGRSVARDILLACESSGQTLQAIIQRSAP